MPDDAFIFLGDALWLDFVNSARGRDPTPPDRLPDLAGFARWCEAQHLDPAGAPLGEVHTLRSELTALAEGLHAGHHPPTATVASLNLLLGRVSGRQQLTRVSGTWSLRFAPDRTPSALEAIARSTAATLACPDLVVRRCAGYTCSLFFTDDTMTGHRRWCDPAVCGRHVRVERRRGARR
jgi:predicted RNA-binding Zn ribbon-like protein